MIRQIRVLICDDHAMLRDGLHSLFAKEPDVAVVGEAADALAAVHQAVTLQPDVVLLDINMPLGGGLEALAKLRDLVPDIRVLMLTMHDDADYLRQALAQGAAGYVLKEAPSDELLTAIRAVHRGGIYLHPRHAQALLTPEAASAPPTRPSVEDEHLDLLSEREAQIFRLVAFGHRNSDIAEMLHLSVKTVETYKVRLMQKLGLRSRAALVRMALELGLLHDGEGRPPDDGISPKSGKP